MEGCSLCKKRAFLPQSIRVEWPLSPIVANEEQEYELKGITDVLGSKIPRTLMALNVYLR